MSSTSDFERTHGPNSICHSIGESAFAFRTAPQLSRPKPHHTTSMKTGYLALLSLGMSLTLGYLMAQTPPAGGPAGNEEKTVLAQNMQKINEARNSLRDSGQLADATKNADSLTKVTTMRDSAIAAQKERPVRTDTVPAAEQAKFVTDYQAQIQLLIDALGEMQVALRANNNAEAERLFGTLGDIQGPGHRAYRPQRGGPGGGRGGPGGPGGARGGPPAAPGN